MRILLINTESTWRGGERQTLYTLQGLAEKGIEADLMALSGSRMEQKAVDHGIRVIPVDGLFDFINKISAVKGKYQCVHAQSAKAHTQAIVAKPFHRMPVIYTRRVDFVPSGWATKLKYRYTDEVVSISESISEILDESGMWHGSEVISSAVKDRNLDLMRATEIKNSLSAREGVKIVGLISALEPHKDPYTALDMVQELRSFRDDFVVMHFGAGALFDEVRARIGEVGLGPYYHLMGHMDGVEDLFSIFDVFVMTSREEGLGSSVLDAFNYKVPVVSTKAGGLFELVQNRGLLCSTGDSRCLAESVNRALDKSQAVNELVVSAKKYSDMNFGVDVMVEKYVSIYERLSTSPAG